MSSEHQHLDGECATERAVGKLRSRHLYDLN